MATLTHEIDIEPDAVIAWRLETLEQAGYPTREACELAAAPHVDLRAAERLLAAGCQPATAVRILL